MQKISNINNQFDDEKVLKQDELEISDQILSIYKESYKNYIFINAENNIIAIYPVNLKYL